MKKIKRNKRGWMKILEAFLAIAFVIGILTILSFNNNKVVEGGFSERIGEKQAEILHLIQTNQSLREEIITASPIPLESNEEEFPNNLNNTMVSLLPNNLNCLLKICAPEAVCELNNYPKSKEIYVQNAIVSSSHGTYNPKKLTLFCWRR